MVTLLDIVFPHRHRHRLHPTSQSHLKLKILIFTGILLPLLTTTSHPSSVNAAAATATPTPAPTNPLMHFFACQQKQNKAVTECSATAFSGLNTATPQLTAADCCSLTSYTNCVVERAVEGDGGVCQAALASVREQMLAALKQNCGTVACSASALSSFFSLHLTLLLSTLATLQLTTYLLTSLSSA